MGAEVKEDLVAEDSPVPAADEPPAEPLPVKGHLLAEEQAHQHTAVAPTQLVNQVLGEEAEVEDQVWQPQPFKDDLVAEDNPDGAEDKTQASVVLIAVAGGEHDKALAVGEHLVCHKFKYNYKLPQQPPNSIQEI